MVLWLVLAAISVFTGYQAILNGNASRPEDLQGWLGPVLSVGTVVPVLMLISLVVRRKLPA